MYTVVIKGNKAQAKAAAALKGFTFLPSKKQARKNQTVGQIKASERFLGEWFTEEALPPFPIGTLLFYTSAKGKKS